MKLTIDLPGLRTSTPGNTRRHWRTEAKAAKSQRFEARLMTRGALDALAPKERAALHAAPRLRVLLTRFSPRRLDVPNMFGALKHVIDGVTDAIGRDDSDPWYEWTIPSQETGPLGVRVTLEARA